MSKLFLIQGLFSQEQQRFGIGYKPGIGEAVFVKPQMIQCFFSGFIGPQPEIAGEFPGMTGMMQDHYGEAEIADAMVTDESVSFTKIYIRRGDPIFYEFTKKEGDDWLGTYKGPAVGKGLAKCRITLVEDTFFDLTSLFESFPQKNDDEE